MPSGVNLDKKNLGPKRILHEIKHLKKGTFTKLNYLKKDLSQNYN